ncbi:hypothetical protein GL218_00866 [Daldinia childiae]|uniref:uncharacterized protein n=1 Tax=Daldinia childiae TaxID=326645 RepID=UPI0014475B6F|nr:uncharacterized protein GL218_00866 [Daldinia childiae]KAF3071223.1 hypothetical protein GL218_00866 [Daldinia childiae]
MGHIQGEMRMYLNHELQAAELFQGRDQKTLHQKKEIHRMLLEQPDCSFYTIQEALGDIKELVSSGGSEAELMKLLAKFSLDPISRLKEDINKLETQLKGRQVDEINELLAWVIFGKRVLTIEELDAALFLRFKRDIIERLDRLQDDEIADCVVKQRETPRMTDDPPRISATITITNVDRTTVQRFLWDLNTYSTLDKFSFQQGSDNSNSPKGHIQVNEVDSHLHIVKLTFEFLHHLKVLYEATGLDVIGPNDKREIGRGIYDLFDDVEIVERHWDSWGATWFRSSEQTSIFWKWLQDPVAISSLSRNDKKLLVNARSDENPDRKLFTPILTHIAHIWLQTRKGAPIVAFSWIRGFLSLGIPKNDSDSDGKDNKTSNDTNAGESAGSSRYDKDSEAVYMAEKWAETVLGPPESNSLWCERIGETFRNMGNHTKAHDYFILAAGVPDANWTAFEGSAECYYHQDDVVNACIMIKKAEEILEHQGEPGKSDLIDIRMRLAGWYASLQQRDDALRCCEAAYNLDPSDTKAQCLLMRQYLKHGKKKEAQQILSKAAACDPSELRPMLEFIVEEEVDEEPYPSFFWNIIRNCESVGSLDILLQDLETAISDTKADGNYYHMSHFLLENLTWRWDRVRIFRRASRVLSWHHFEKLREAPESERHVAELERLVTEQYQINPGLSAAKCYLAVYYTSRNEKEKARKVFLSDMGTAFRILSDNTSINDWEGYSILADIMLYTGDEANSTAASWQLAPAVINADIIAALLKSEESITREPVVTAILRIFNSSSHQEHDPEKSIKLLIDETSKLARLAAEKDEEFLERQYLAARSLLEAHELVIQQDFQYICDGCESRRWGFENAMNPCKFCYNTGFCDGCLADLKASSSSSSPAGQWHVCDPHHEWLRLPRWEVDRYVRACKRIVQVQYGEDGEVTAVACAASEWLAKLRVGWGLSSEDWPDSIFVQPLSRSLGG